MDRPEISKRTLSGRFSAARPPRRTVGVATPIAGDLYSVSNIQAVLAFGTVMAAGFAWLAARHHPISRRKAHPEESTAINQDFILAFVVMPVVVLGLGYLSLRLLDWNLCRTREKTPVE